MKTHHRQNNGQMEGLNWTILSALHAYLYEQSRDWDLYTSTLMYVYNFQPQPSTSLAPSELVLFNPPGQIAMQKQTYAPKEPTDQIKVERMSR